VNKAAFQIQVKGGLKLAPAPFSFSQGNKVFYQIEKLFSEDDKNRSPHMESPYELGLTTKSEA